MTTPGDVPQTSELWSATVCGTTATGLDRSKPSTLQSRLIGSLEGSLQVDLTRIEIVRRYLLSGPLESLSYRRDCRANSVFEDHILW